ncbi:MAG: hypothetical protein PHC51_03375 [bacterium]|nr:hypothetical protein [bacterium]
MKFFDVNKMTREQRRFWRYSWRTCQATLLAVVCLFISSLHLIGSAVEGTHRFGRFTELVTAGEWFLAIIMFVFFFALGMFMFCESWSQADSLRRRNYCYYANEDDEQSEVVQKKAV